MAIPYFWVAGAGNFNSLTTANISLTSGGAGGAGPVTAADSLTFDNLSSASAYAVSMTGGTRSVLNLTMGAPASGALTWSGTGALVVAGSLNLSGGANITRTFTGNITFSSTTTGNTIASHAVALGSGITFDGIGGGWSDSDDLSTTGNVALTNGALSLNGHNATVLAFLSNNANTRAFTFTGSEILTVTVAGTGWNTANATGMAFTPASGTIKFTDTSATQKTLSSAGLTFNKLWFSGAGTGPNRISGNGNTFATILMDSTLAAKTLLLASGMTTNVTTAAGLQIDGDATHQTSLQASTGGVAASLSIPSGTVNLHNVTVTDITATGGATFNAFTSNGCVDGGGNTGWNFSAQGAAETLYLMRHKGRR